MMHWFAWLRRLVDRFRAPRAVPPVSLHSPQPEPPPPPEPAPPSPVPEPETVAVSPNRATRRMLERRRRRHDKFVIPKGALPPPKEPKPRAEVVRKPRPIEVVDDKVTDAELLIADVHHEDTEDVLYKEAELHGEFHFRDTILQQLERYFVYLERMRRNDPSTYHLYRQYGATILPYVNVNAHDRGSTIKEPIDITRETPLSDWFHRTRPSFGCYAYGVDPETERYEQSAEAKEIVKNQPDTELWIPKFMYFRKYKIPPCDVERVSGGDTYAMTIWWDRPFSTHKNKKNHGVPQEYGVWVSADGKQIEILRSLVIHKEWKVEKRGQWRGRSYAIPTKHWQIPRDFVEWAQREGDNPRHFLREIFLQAVQTHAMTQLNMVRITATKGNMSAAFSVDIHKMSYFFQDRDIYATERGQRKRIFHMVRPHVRADGTVIKAHFRGQREFTWADYNILITVPGRDHLLLDDVDFGMITEDDAEPGKKYVGTKQVGQWLAEEMRKPHPSQRGTR